MEAPIENVSEFLGGPLPPALRRISGMVVSGMGVFLLCGNDGRPPIYNVAVRFWAAEAKAPNEKKA